MKRLALITLVMVVVAAVACTQKPTPANQPATVAADEQLAIAVEYVAVPSMKVYARPAEDAEVIGSYGLKEAISVLERNGAWSRIRTFDGDGWVKQADLMIAEVADQTDTNIPRFYVEPKQIPFSTHGEIWLQAQVNTDGDVIGVKLTKNTTGFTALGDANADALKSAKFFPMIDKGTRKTFVYEHRVYY